MSEQKTQIEAELIGLKRHFKRRQQELADHLKIDRSYLNQLLGLKRLDGIGGPLRKAISDAHKQFCLQSPQIKPPGNSDAVQHFVEYVSADVKIRVPVLSDPALNEAGLRNAERLIFARAAAISGQSSSLPQGDGSRDKATEEAIQLALRKMFEAAQAKTTDTPATDQ